MKNHQISATLHWKAAYHFSLGTQPGSTVYVETTEKSYLNVYIGATVFEGSLDQRAGANYREALLERGVAAVREQNLLLGASLLPSRWVYLPLAK